MIGYESLHSASAWIDTTARGRIRLTGEDRARLLHAMTTNDVQSLTPGAGCYAFFLNAQGRILADAGILCFEDHMLLDVEPEVRRKIFEHLDRFIIADDVQLEDVTDSTAYLEIGGPQAEGTLRALGAPIPERDYASANWGNRFVVRIDEERFRILAPLSEKADLAARLGPASDTEAWNVWRLERAIPRYGDDITERHLLQETRQMQAASFTKGCYLGQEIVERVRSRGQVHKGLAPVEIDTQAVPSPGSAILDSEGAKCGDPMSAAFSPAIGRVVGFAYMRTDQLGPQAKSMTLDGSTVRLRESS